MGGTGSGRWGGRATVEGCRTLTVAAVMGKRTGKARQGWRGSIDWTNGYTGELVLRVSYETVIDGDHGWVWLTHEAGQGTDAPRPMSDEIHITGVPQPFGGLRWFFLCPLTGRLVLKVHLPAGRLKFASRLAYRLGYRSQRESPRDRAASRYWKARRRLMGDDDVKPKFMHWRTFDAKLADLEAKEQALNAHMVMGLRMRGRINTTLRKAGLV